MAALLVVVDFLILEEAASMVIVVAVVIGTVLHLKRWREGVWSGIVVRGGLVALLLSLGRGDDTDTDEFWRSLGAGTDPTFFLACT